MPKKVVSILQNLLLGAGRHLPPPGCSGGFPPDITFALETFEYNSAEDLGKTNANVSLVILSKCMD